MNAIKLFNTRQERQLELEKLYDKNQLMKRVRQAFKENQSINFPACLENANIPVDFGIDLLAQMAVHKRALVPTIVGCLRHHFESDQETANMLERAVNARCVEYSSRDSMLIVKFEISKELQTELDHFQFPLPMVISPAPLKSNLDTGYLTARNSVILQDNHHDDDVCLDHLNRTNDIKLSINLDVAQTIQNQWKGLDRQRDDETWDDFKKRRKAFEKYDSVAKNVIGLVAQEDNEMYLTHRYDFRGRTYCMGHHITYQGTDWNKAVIEFADKEVLPD